nr:hypothetical protein [Tanacetum cinerariifolium]
MDTTIDQQLAMDEALVPTAQRLRIRRSNFCLLSDIKSKETTLQLVYDVLRICPFFKAFLVTADHIVNLESFRDILHICPRVHGQSFAEPPFKEEILAFIHFLGHSAAIKMPLISSWRSYRYVRTTSNPPDTGLRLGSCLSYCNCIILFVSLRVPEFIICQLYGQQSTELLHVLVFGYQLDYGEHMVIPDIVPVHLFSPGIETTDEGTYILATVDGIQRTAVNEQLKAKVLSRSSHSSRTSYVVAADLFEMELKKILIEKMEGNKSIQCSDEQRNLYKALVEAYESDKLILDTYEETVTLKRRRDDDADKNEEPSAGPDRGSKRCREGKEPESASAPMETATRSADDQPIVQSSQHLEWFTPQQKSPTPNRDWNKTLSAVHGSIQPWISELAKQADSYSPFNELMDIPLDFSNFQMNRLRVDTLTLKLLAGPTYELMKGSCKILVELEYHLEEVYKAIIDQLDWVNPKGQQYPHNLLQPLPLIPNNRGRRVIPFEQFINNDLEYLRGGLVHRTMWIQELIGYDKHALWEVSHWGRKHQQFYGFVVNRESTRDLCSKRRIIAVTELKIVELHSYKHLDWITVRRDDDKLYKFKEGDFKRLRIQEIEDMARPIGMKGFAMWDWGHRVTWGVGGVNGTVQVRGSAQEKAVGVIGVLAGNSASPTTTTTITPVTNAQLKALIDQGIADALAARNADRSRNGNDNYNSGTETVFNISNYAVENQVKFATCTLHDVALSWWKSHVKTVGQDVAHESGKIEKYAGGLPDMIHGSVMASKPKTMQDAVEFVTELMDKKICTFAKQKTENKRKFEDTSRNNQNQ